MSSLSDYERWWRKELAGFDCSPADESEVVQLRTEQPLGDLPVAYESFLRVAGRRCGELWVGSDNFFPELLGLRSAAHELLATTNAEFRLTERHVAIGMHQGYQFLYLDVTEPRPDPPVFRYVEGHQHATQVSPSFTALVTSLTGS